MRQNRQKPVISLPDAPVLDTLPISEVPSALEEHGVRLSVDSLNWPEQFPYRPLTVVSAAHTSTAIYLEFLVRCNYLRAENYTDNSQVSRDSCVEFYVAADPASPADYVSIGINCIGTVRATAHRSDGTARVLGTDELARIQRYASVGTRPFREVEGSFIWSVTVAIPLDLVGIRYDGAPVRVAGNFNKCATDTSQPHYLSWAPIDSPEPDFHRPEAFATITLE